MLAKYKHILWDFDGVIMDSMPIRNAGFEMVLKDYPEAQVALLMSYHLANGGLSRYVKFRYFFEAIRNEPVTDAVVQELAAKFSEIMLAALIDEALLIQDTVQFIAENYQSYNMHIVSGSDGNELRHICELLGLSKYFVSINGSPTPKKTLVDSLITSHHYRKDDCVLIGDSRNDLEAADANGITFFGYNNESLMALSGNYIYKFALT